MSFDVDLFVIGGGSGGVRAARIAASQHGATVALAEESRMGGTCVIRGCVPKKLMIYASEAPHMAWLSRGYGWQGATAGQFDWATFRAALDLELSRLEGLYRQGLTGAGVAIHDQRARLADAHTVVLHDGTRVQARHILIATGGRPNLPGIPGQELGLISDDLFRMPRVPPRALIVGGGFIACEYATILNGLGSQVVMTYRGAAILRGFDDDGRADTARQLADIGVDLRCGCGPQRLDRAADGAVRATFSDGQTGEFDAVFFATGRVPNTAGLGLADVGVALGGRGQIVVNDWSQTSVPSVFAVGDVTDRVNLTPVAIREGHAFADTVFGARARSVDHSLVPAAVYTRPNELGAVGLTEAAAAAQGEIEVYETRFRPMRSLFAGSDARVMMKLIVCAQTRKVLGCTLFAPDAGEMIQLVAVAVGMGATKEDFDRTIAVHPTMAEELVTLRNPTRKLGGAVESAPA